MCQNIRAAFCSVQLFYAHLSEAVNYDCRQRKCKRYTLTFRLPCYENSHFVTPLYDSKQYSREKSDSLADHHSDNKSKHFKVLHFHNHFLQVLRLIVSNISSRIFIANYCPHPFHRSHIYVQIYRRAAN